MGFSRFIVLCRLDLEPQCVLTFGSASIQIFNFSYAPLAALSISSSKKIKKSIASRFHFDRLPAPRRPQGQEDSMFADR